MTNRAQAASSLEMARAIAKKYGQMGSSKIKAEVKSDLAQKRLEIYCRNAIALARRGKAQEAIRGLQFDLAHLKQNPLAFAFNPLAIPLLERTLSECQELENRNQAITETAVIVKDMAKSVKKMAGHKPVRTRQSDERIAALEEAVRLKQKEIVDRLDDVKLSDRDRVTYRLFFKTYNAQMTADELTRLERRKRRLTRQAVHKRLDKIEVVTGISIPRSRQSLKDQVKENEKSRVEGEVRRKVTKRI